MTLAKSRRQSGIALVLVLWVLILLTVMAVSLTATQRTETALTENHVSAVRFRALADAAIAYAALDFMASATSTEALDAVEAPWLPNGAPRRWRFAGSDVSIAVFNETSRIDLNLAAQGMLEALIGVLGAPEDQAAELAAAIIDFRDEDDLVSLNGAEDDEYEAAGRRIGAKDAPFEVVDELRQVLGMSEELYRRLAPEVTVDGENATPNERFSSPAVLAAIQGITLGEAAERVSERDDPVLEDAVATAGQDRGGPLYRVQVTQGGVGRAGRRMEALIRLAQGQQPPYQVFWRRYGLSTQDPVYIESDAVAE